MTVGVSLFTFSVFAAAFLIFGVQPMVGKHILPWFGGTPAVWMTCLAFYQTALFVGYAYAYGLVARVPPAAQPWIHAGVFIASLIALPVLPGAEWKPLPGLDASGQILSMLTVSLALPFVLLASTGPLLQVWFGRAFPGRSPYVLYAVSNLGSLLGLLSFPFLIEPRIGLALQSRIWSISFAVAGAAVLVCAVLGTWGASSREDVADSSAAESLSASRVALWILLPAAAVITFMGVTNHLCLDVASVPFLWVLPLSIYLVTLVICFGSERFYRRDVFMTLALVSLGAMVVKTLSGSGMGFGFVMSESLVVTVALYTSLLFFACMVAHGELYRLRPAVSRLTMFYLCVAGGGALGGLFVGLLAPRIFDRYYELPIGLAACGLLALLAMRRSPSGLFAGKRRQLAWSAVGLAMVGALGGLAIHVASVEPGTLSVHRNFFGVLRVVERESPRPHVLLRHGTTKHGQQYRGELGRKPLSYYGTTSGIGIVLTDLLAAEAPPRRIGIVGLGVGTLAAYGRAQDRIVFFEIDPDVARIARDSRYFSYLGNSVAPIEIVLGDARLSLEADIARGALREFDVLALDAFSSDAIPLHLLTLEAFRIYAAHLADGGLIAVHVSNRHFALYPLVARLGQAVGLHAVAIDSRPQPQGIDAARWMILVRDPSETRRLASRVAGLPPRQGLPVARAGRVAPAVLESTPLWTDDFSDVWGSMRASRDGGAE